MDGVWSWEGVRVEEAVGQGATDTLVEEDEHEGNANAFGSEAVGIMPALALQ